MDAAHSEVEQLKKQLAEQKAAHAADLQRVTIEKDNEVARITSDLQRITIEKDNEVAHITSELQRVTAEKDIEVARITSERDRINSDYVKLFQMVIGLEDTISFLTRTINGIIEGAFEMSKDESLSQEARDRAGKLITVATATLEEINSNKDDTFDKFFEKEEELNKEDEAVEQDEMILDLDCMNI